MKDEGWSQMVNGQWGWQQRQQERQWHKQAKIKKEGGKVEEKEEEEKNVKYTHFVVKKSKLGGGYFFCTGATYSTPKEVECFAVCRIVFTIQEHCYFIQKSYKYVWLNG